MDEEIPPVERPARPLLLLISGVPATGKTTFASWLAENRGFLAADVERGGLGPLGLQSEWDEAVGRGRPAGLTAALGALHQPVALDWGYPTNSLPFVEALCSAGVDAWWFDGDWAAARRHFIERGTVPVDALDRQMANIQAAWPRLAAFYGGRIIHTVDAEGRFVDWADVLDRIVGKIAKS